jgi:hypothetical protein
MNSENYSITDGTYFDGKQVIMGSFTGSADLGKITQELADEFSSDFAEKWGPATASAKAALNKAVNKAFNKKTHKVDNREQGCWVISEVNKTSDNVGVEYDTQLKVWVRTENNRPTLYYTYKNGRSGDWPAFIGSPTDEFAAEAGLTVEMTTLIRAWIENYGELTGDLLRKSVKAFLRGVGDSVSCTPGNSAGNVEFVPARNWDEVSKYLDIISRNSQVCFNKFSMVASDSDAVESLTQSLLEECQLDVASIDEEMIEFQKGDRGCEMRQSTLKQRAALLAEKKAKMERYALICGNAFADMEQQLDKVAARCRMVELSLDMINERNCNS